MKLLLNSLVLVLIVLLAGCGGREVTRTDPDLVTDLSGYWNETDAHMVADSIVDQCLDGRWLTEFGTGDRSRGERAPQPVVVVGSIFNESSEHINTDLFMNEIERALLESGEVKIAAGGASRGEVRAERSDQSIFSSPETAAEYGREIGADYVMTGNIGSIVDEEDHTRSIYYQVSIELIDVETALKAWIGSLEIKKMIEW
ncbi:MAG: penicillin-binding protein activator LpoB [Candidatus Aegiribacteria sp.]|nr:penicillin-binding protein activator LpoB [Candidatus Aegiribacteria sp.]